MIYGCLFSTGDSAIASFFSVFFLLVLPKNDSDVTIS